MHITHINFRACWHDTRRLPARQVLSKHQFLQTGSNEHIEGTLFESMKVVLRDASLKYELIMAGKQAPENSVLIICRIVQ